MDGCIFCKIVAGEIPSNKVYEDDACFVIHDIAPKAPVHLLVISKRHVKDLTEAASDEAMMGAMMAVAATVAKHADIADTGYRVITNIGKHGGQAVPHLHLHVLGGAQLNEKMG